MGTFNKQTRIKDFEGLPHALKGLDYTDDAEVEGGEKAYTPRGSKNEFIFRKISKHIKELKAEDNKRQNRPVGDRISDISFDAAATEIILKEVNDLVSEGIDPFNVEGNQDQNEFKTGGVNYATGGTNRPRYSTPTISDDANTNNIDPNYANENIGFTPTSSPTTINPGSNLNTNTNNVGLGTTQENPTQLNNFFSAPKQFGNESFNAGEDFTNENSFLPNEDPLFADPQRYNEASVMPNTSAPIKSDTAVPSTTAKASTGFNTATAAINAASTMYDTFKKPNTVNQDAMQNKDYIDTMAKIAKKRKDLTTGTAIAGTTAVALNAVPVFGQIASAVVGAGTAIAGGVGTAALDKEEKTALSDANAFIKNEKSRAARGRFQGEAEVPRTRYNDTTEFKNGGMKKKYAGNYGSVRPTDPNDPSNDPWSTEFDSTPTMNPLYNTTGVEGLSGDELQTAFLDRLKVSGGTGQDRLSTNKLPQVDYKSMFDNANNAVNLDEYSNIPTDEAAIPPPKKEGMTPEQIKQLYQGVLSFGGNAASSLAYLAKEPKDGDPVNYPTFKSGRMSAQHQLRAARDMGATAMEVARQSGRADPSTLATLATSGSQNVAGIRESVANTNISLQAQEDQINNGTIMRAMQDEAANKGVAQSNYYEAIDGLGRAGAGTTRQMNTMDTNAMLREMYENTFGVAKTA